jgi:hypothetical protein
MKAYAEIAVAFASALVKGEWVGANALLASNLRDDLSPTSRPVMLVGRMYPFVARILLRL